MPTSILEVKNLRKTYENITAVDDVSFRVEAGEVVGLLGPNGAGKTTIISALLGVLEPSGGVIRVLGENLKERRSEIMAKANFAAVYAQLPGNMTIWENLYTFTLLYNVPGPKERVREVIRTFDLESFTDTRSGLLSSGENTRVTLAKAMLNSPSLLLLDEPTASLDPSSAHLIRDQITDYAKTKGAGVLWTSHNMHEVEAVCTRVLFLSHGKILLEGDPKVLPKQHKKKNLEELFITVAREPLSLEL
ncbi:ABC transporter ATP-binding protein [Candidatus Parcubacteria bacterium]|nr:MAG: ABC transporter ATP-binding protein [Candidatus Parcubacteria bacterium]